MVTVIIILLYFLIIVFDFLPLLKERKKVLLGVYLVFLTISFCILILNSLGVKVPSPAEPIKSVVEKLLY